MFVFFDKKATYCVDPKIKFIKKGSVVLVLSKKKDSVFELKDVERLIWESLEKPKSVTDLAKIIQKKYKVSNEKAEADLISWLKDALKEKIIIKS